MNRAFKNKGIYMDYDSCLRFNLVGKIRVNINGGSFIKEATRAKSGKNGFVEFAEYPVRFRNGDIAMKKLKGNVKISFDTSKEALIQVKRNA